MGWWWESSPRSELWKLMFYLKTTNGLEPTEKPPELFGGGAVRPASTRGDRNSFRTPSGTARSFASAGVG